MDVRAQLEDERQRLEADLLTLEKAIDDQRRQYLPLEALNAQGEAISLLNASFESHFARLKSVNERLAQMRR